MTSFSKPTMVPDMSHPKQMARTANQTLNNFDLQIYEDTYANIVMVAGGYPESYEKGPLAIVQNGDLIKLDVPNRKIDLLISEVEMNNRISVLSDNQIKRRGYNKLYMEEVTQADEGVDFKFLK